MKYRILAVCFALVITVSSAFASGYRARIIEPIGEMSFDPYDISDTGIVVGSFTNYDIDPQRYEHAFMWSAETETIDMGRGSATAVNSSGFIAGVTNHEGSHWSDAALWAPGQPVRCFDNLGGPSYALDVNDLNVVVGYSYTTYQHAVRWDPTGDLQALEDDGYCWSQANSVNLSGQIAGYAVIMDPGGLGVSKACIWDQDLRIHEIGTLGGEFSKAYAINNVGQVIGEAETSEHSYSSFIWDAEHGMRDIGHIGATDINDLGQVVGWTFYGAYIWQDGVTTRLEMPDGYMAKRAYAINNAGWIVGICQTPIGETKAVLWEPVPEPASLLPLATGILTLVVYRKRRL